MSAPSSPDTELPNRIGPLVRSFRSPAWWASPQASASVLGVVGIGLCMTVSMTLQYGLVGLLALPLTLVSVTLVVRSRARTVKNMAILLHENGLLVETQHARAVVRFDDVREVLAYISREDGTFLLSHLTLRDAAGLHVLPVGLLDAASITSVLEERTLDPEFQRALAEITSGGRQQFGNVILDGFGINTAHWSLRWDKITKLVIDQGAVQLFRDNQAAASACIYWEHLPNPLLFSRLVRELSRRARVARP